MKQAKRWHRQRIQRHARDDAREGRGSSRTSLKLMLEASGRISRKRQRETSNSSEGASARKLQSDGSPLRQINLAALMPVTVEDGTGSRMLNNYRVYHAIGAWLAIRQVNLTILPEVSQILETCDLEFSVDMHDTQFSPLLASRHLVEYYTTTQGNTSESSLLNIADGSFPLTPSPQGRNRTATRFPVAAIGGARSVVSESLSVLSAAYDVVQISPSSTSSVFDSDRASHSTFARTVASNLHEARALVQYLSTLGVDYVGVLYSVGTYGSSYFAHLINEASSVRINVLSAGYSSQNTIRSALQQLKASDLRVMVGILDPLSWQTVLEEGAAEQIMGRPGYTWFLTDSVLEITDSTFSLRRGEQGMASALNGIGIISTNVESHGRIDAAIENFRGSSSQKKEFIAAYADDAVVQLLEEYPFPPASTASLYQYTSFDAVTALMVASCRTERPFRAKNLLRNLQHVSFTGASGFVAFDPVTGSRRDDNSTYQILNVLLSDERSDESRIFFNVKKSVQVDVKIPGEDGVQNLWSFVYSDNSTELPPALPPVDLNLNLMSSVVRIVGLSICGLVMLNSFGWMIWTYVNRARDCVRASQPVFLIQICLGTLLMASTIIPLSMQGPTTSKQLNIACMATPWLVSVGFVTAFSALFSKTRRLNRLFQNGKAFRRVEVRARDVMYPFLILMGLNLTFLTLWSVRKPMLYERKMLRDNVDRFGRPAESIGVCRSKGDEDEHFPLYIVPIFALNTVALIFANYEAYKARVLPTDFSESFYVAFSMGSLLETGFLAVPLLLLARDNPSVNFLLMCILLGISCLGIQLPLFLPKFLHALMDDRRQAERGLERGLPFRGGIHVSGLHQPRRSIFAGVMASVRRSRSSEGGDNRESETGATRVKRSQNYYRQRARNASRRTNSDALNSSHSSISLKVPLRSRNPFSRSRTNVLNDSDQSSRPLGSEGIGQE